MNGKTYHYLIGGKYTVEKVSTEVESYGITLHIKNDEYVSITNLNTITRVQNAARWLNSDKVKKYLQERIKFYSGKDSLFE